MSTPESPLSRDEQERRARRNALLARYADPKALARDIDTITAALDDPARLPDETVRDLASALKG